MTPHRLARHTIRMLAITLLAISTYATPTTAQTVTLNATLTPEQLGRGTTIGFGFDVTTPANQAPPPLTNVEISYPVELAFALSELGLATCTTQTLEALGAEGCPANSVMGYGTALAEVPLGPSIASETAQVTILRAANRAGHLALLIYVDAPSPISGQVTLPALILPANAPYGGRLDIHIPLIPGLPQAPDVAVVQFRSTLGPLHLRYREHTHGHTIEYQPKGPPLPSRCPHGGFHFAATFAFQDGSHAKATTTVRCPPTRRRHKPG